MPRSPLPGPLRHQLGGYREYEVSERLAGVAEAAWIHRAPAEEHPGPQGMHRVLPDPSLNLAFRCRRTADDRPMEPGLVIIGPKTRPFLFRFRPGHEIASVKVKLEWAKYLLRLDPADHLEAEHDLALVHPDLAGRLLESLARTRSAGEAVAVLVGALQALRDITAPGTPRAVAPALDMVRAAAGRLRIEVMADRMGVSLRQLRRAVRAEAAIPLKAYARMTRLNAAMAAADRCDRPQWARIACDAGFCDQSHLVRECRMLAGLAPGLAHRERRAQADLSNRAGA